jgi:hypothetical protein
MRKTGFQRPDGQDRKRFPSPQGKRATGFAGHARADARRSEQLAPATEMSLLLKKLIRKEKSSTRVLEPIAKMRYDWTYMDLHVPAKKRKLRNAHLSIGGTAPLQRTSAAHP